MRLTVNIVLAVLGAVSFAAQQASADAPRHVYLTWQGDTSRTMTVTFQTEAAIEQAIVYYDTERRGGIRGNYAQQATGTSQLFEGLRRKRYVHNVELTGLEPGTAYHFVAGDRDGDIYREQKFRTIPDGDATIRFFTGGDMDVVREVGELLTEAAKRDPMFGLIGGDLAYANGDLRAYRKWDRWFDNWAENAVTPDGFMVPMVVGIGNHEVDGSYGQKPEKAPFYFGYFAQGGRSYFSRTFGENVAILTLDTGHIIDHEDQVDWMEEELSRLADVPQKFAVYHVPLYPSVRNYNSEMMVAGRTHWVPLFDRFHLTAAFENHDHALKRTARIKGNRINPAGTLYLGDGCLGQDSRDIELERRWYEERASSTPHFWFVEADRDGARFEAVDTNGEVVDRVALP